MIGGTAKQWLKAVKRDLCGEGFCPICKYDTVLMKEANWSFTEKCLVEELLGRCSCMVAKINSYDNLDVTDLREELLGELKIALEDYIRRDK